MGDVDGDHRPDLFVGDFLVPGSAPPAKAPDHLYLNAGNWRFRRVDDSPAAQDPSRTYGASFTDWDDDGDDDLTVTNIAMSDRNVIYENTNGQLRARRDLGPSQSVTGPSKGHAWGDYDNDGDQDLYIAEGTEGLTAAQSPFDLKNVLFEQDQGRLTRVETGVAVEEAWISAGVAHADIDLDGDLDLMVANWGGEGQPNSLYRNQLGGRSLSFSLRGGRSNRQGIGARAELTVARDGRRLTRHASLWPQTGYGSMNAPVLWFGLRAKDRPLTLTVTWPSGRRRSYKILAGARRFIASENGRLTPLD